MGFAREQSMDECPLPYDLISTASWCKLQVVYAELPIATYGIGSRDIVSTNICQNKKWEHGTPEELGLPVGLTNADGGPPRVLDIGGNVGSFSLVFAKSGYKVTTVEAMLQNVRLINATFCANPSLRANVVVDHAIVGNPAQAGSVCKVCIDFGGDATVLCPGDSRGPNCNTWWENRTMREQVAVKTLDQIIEQYGLDHHGAVDVVKIDIEGYENEAMKGAIKLLSQVRPRYIVSEIQNNRPNGALVGVTPGEYVDKLRSFNYDVFTDRFGGTPLIGNPTIEPNGAPLFFFKQRGA